MFNFNSSVNILIQGCVLSIIIGMSYLLWSNARIYGGLIGVAVKFLGIGILFVAISAIEKIITNFQIIEITPNLALAQDFSSSIGLVFLFIGFSKLGSATKS